MTHRIHSIKGVRGQRVFATKGDFNKIVDAWTFTLSQPTQAKVAFHVPYVGFAIAALSDRSLADADHRHPGGAHRPDDPARPLARGRAQARARAVLAMRRRPFAAAVLAFLLIAACVYAGVGTSGANFSVGRSNIGSVTAGDWVARP